MTSSSLPMSIFLSLSRSACVFCSNYSICAICSDLEIKLSHTEAVLPFIICNDMERAFPNISILYRIYQTLPVTSANAEHSFSRLKLIKNYFSRHAWTRPDFQTSPYYPLRGMSPWIRTRWLKGLRG